MTDSEFLHVLSELCSRHGAARVMLFGSRARGTNDFHSDYDLAVFGLVDTAKLEEAIDELPTLRSVDIVNMETCSNPYLIQEIKEHGVLL